MKKQPSSRILVNHPPKEYYELWCEKWGLDQQKYPYLKSDFIPSKGQVVPFAVFDFDICRDDFGHQVAMAKVRYKALFSKDEFEVIAYL